MGLSIERAVIKADFYSTTTNSSGEYTISNFPVGYYTVSAEKEGYSSSSATATIIKDQTTTLNFQLSKKIPIYILGDINKDGKVNSLDFSLLIKKWKQTENIQNEDLNQDDKVDIRDLGDFNV